MPEVYDSSYAHPGAAAIKADGGVGCIRYTSWQPVKNLSPTQLTDLHSHGLSAGIVWETTANRANAGYQAGWSDGSSASIQADRLLCGHCGLSWPSGVPIYTAVDFDAYGGAVRPYLEGFRDACKQHAVSRPFGIYGSYGVIEYNRDLTPYLWQCAAWSGSIYTSGLGTGGSIDARRLSKHAVLFQRLGYRLGTSCDANVVLSDDYGCWKPDISHDDEEDKDDLMGAKDEILQTIGQWEWDTRKYVDESQLRMAAVVINEVHDQLTHLTNALKAAGSIPADYELPEPNVNDPDA